MSDKPKDDEQVPGGDLSGNEDGASSDGDSGPGGAAAGSRRPAVARAARPDRTTSTRALLPAPAPADRR